MPEDTALGPLDFIVLEFPEGAATAPVAAALGGVLDRGIVRLFDIAAVRKDADGTVSHVDLAEGAPGLNAFAAFAGAQSGLFDDSDVDQAGEVLEPGMFGLVVAFENTWASGFVSAAHAAGGRVVASERIPAQTLLDALDALDLAEADA